MSDGFFEIAKIIFPLFQIFVIFCLCLCVFLVAHKFYHSNRIPVSCVEAKIIKKRQFLDLQLNKYTGYYVIFEICDGKKLEFPVTRAQYNRLFENAAGELKFKSRKFIKFIKFD